jgi:hypothetical protein
VVDLFDRSVDERHSLHALTAQTALLLGAAKLFWSRRGPSVLARALPRPSHSQPSS